MQSHEQGIPQHVFDNKQSCTDFVACMKDNKDGYGFIPVSPLQLYTGDPTYCQNIPDIIRLHKIVAQSGIPNFGCQIPVFWWISMELLFMITIQYLQP